MLIRLTKKTGSPVSVSVSRVACLYPAADGGTIITFSEQSDDYISVREAYDDVHSEIQQAMLRVCTGRH